MLRQQKNTIKVLVLNQAQKVNFPTLLHHLMQFPNYTPNPIKNSFFYYDDYWCLRNNPAPVQYQVQIKFIEHQIQIESEIRKVYYKSSYSLFKENYYYPYKPLSNFNKFIYTPNTVTSAEPFYNRMSCQR